MKLSNELGIPLISLCKVEYLNELDSCKVAILFLLNRTLLKIITIPGIPAGIPVWWWWWWLRYPQCMTVHDCPMWFVGTCWYISLSRAGHGPWAPHDPPHPTRKMSGWDRVRVRCFWLMGPMGHPGWVLGRVRVEGFGVGLRWVGSWVRFGLALKASRPHIIIRLKTINIS